MMVTVTAHNDIIIGASSLLLFYDLPLSQIPFSL